MELRKRVEKGGLAGRERVAPVRLLSAFRAPCAGAPPPLARKGQRAPAPRRTRKRRQMTTHVKSTLKLSPSKTPRAALGACSLAIAFDTMLP